MASINLPHPEEAAEQPSRRTHDAAPARFAKLDRTLAWTTEVPAAILVVVEIAVLFSGVVARYAFNQPLVWSDELASVLFLWLAMFGAVIALRRHEHMRLTALVKLARPRRRAFLETLSAIVVAIFVLQIILPAYEYVESEWLITTPALAISDGLRVAAIGVGAALMLVIALARLAEFATRRDVAFGVSTMAYLALATHAPLTIVVNRIDQGMSSLILLSVPLFVFLGVLIEMTGLARALVDAIAALLGHIRGGLAYVLLGAMYLVSGISGSKAADMAAVAPVLFPEMRRRGAVPGELGRAVV